jgi:hypothetical protein
MIRFLSLKYSLEHVATIVALVSSAGVLHSFFIGKHYLIPTMCLALAVLFGNLARYGYRDQHWARQILFWIFVILNAHVLFALFFSVKYREILGDAFEYVFAPLTVILAFLVWQYAIQNELFKKSD